MAQKLKEPQGRFAYWWNTLNGLWEPATKLISVSKTVRYAIPIAATGTTFDLVNVMLYGVVTKMILEIPTYTNDKTTTPSIIDENSVTVWTGSAYARTTNQAISMDVEVFGRYTVRLTLSDVAGGSALNCYVTMFVR